MKEIGNIYDRYDLFAAEIPRFHLEGFSKIGTRIGCFFSILLVTLVFGYGFFRADILVRGDRPNISSYTVSDERKGRDLHDLNIHDFKVAFTVEKIEQEGIFRPISDPDFVEWIAYFYDMERGYTLVHVHNCTAQDYDEFHDLGEG